MRTRDMTMVASSHQNGAADSLRATNRAMTANVASTTLMVVPTQTFQAIFSSGGNGASMMKDRSRRKPKKCDRQSLPKSS